MAAIHRVAIPVLIQEVWDRSEGLWFDALDRAGPPLRDPQLHPWSKLILIPHHIRLRVEALLPAIRQVVAAKAGHREVPAIRHRVHARLSGRGCRTSTVSSVAERDGAARRALPPSVASINSWRTRRARGPPTLVGTRSATLSLQQPRADVRITNISLEHGIGLVGRLAAEPHEQPKGALRVRHRGMAAEILADSGPVQAQFASQQGASSASPKPWTHE